MSMYDDYYRQGFMAKAAERGYPDYAMAPVGAVVGGLSGAATVGATSAATGGLSYGILGTLIGRLMAGRNRWLKLPAAVLGGTLGTGLGIAKGSIVGGLEGLTSGAQIGWRRGLYGGRPQRQAQDPRAAMGRGFANSIISVGNMAPYVERTSGSLGRALAATQMDEMANLAMAPVLAAKIVRGKRMRLKGTVIGSLLASTLAYGAGAMALAAKPRSAND